MQNQQQFIASLEASIERSEADREFGKAIDRLYRNPDFKTVILKGYLEQEAIRLVHCRTDPNMQKADQQADLIRQIDGVACFKDFLRTKLMLADQAGRSIEEAQEMRTALLEESDE